MYYVDELSEPLLSSISILSYFSVFIICIFTFTKFKKCSHDFWYLNPWLAYLVASLTRLLTVLWLDDSFGAVIRFVGMLSFHLLGWLYGWLYRIAQKKAYPLPNWSPSSIIWSMAFIIGGRVSIV